MPSTINTIHVKKERGKLVVQGIGKTPRGKGYILKTIALDAKTPADPAFKSQLAEAVKQMDTESLPTP